MYSALRLREKQQRKCLEAKHIEYASDRIVLQAEDIDASQLKSIFTK